MSLFIKFFSLCLECISYCWWGFTRYTSWKAVAWCAEHRNLFLVIDRRHNLRWSRPNDSIVATKQSSNFIPKSSSMDCCQTVGKLKVYTTNNLSHKTQNQFLHCLSMCWHPFYCRLLLPHGSVYSKWGAHRWLQWWEAASRTHSIKPVVSYA